MGPSLSDLVDCTPEPYLDTVGNQVVTVPCDKHGQFVHFTARGTSTYRLGMFSLCEVVVTAWTGEIKDSLNVIETLI